MVIDEDWGEPLLDLRTADKRTRVAAKVNGWIDECASKGYKAIEPDNYDSYNRSKSLLTTSQAKAYLTLLATHAHSQEPRHRAEEHRRTGRRPDRASASTSPSPRSAASTTSAVTMSLPSATT